LNPNSVEHAHKFDRQRVAHRLALLPFALFLIVLPFPGTVALRLLCLIAAAGVAFAYWWQHPEDRPAIPCKAAWGAWIVIVVASLAYSVDPAYSLGEIKNELGYAMLAFLSFFTVGRDKETIVFLSQALLLGFAIIGIWGLLAWFDNARNWVDGGGYGGVGVFSTYIVTILPVLLFLVLRPGTHMPRLFAAVLLVFALLLTGLVTQRATWLVLLLQGIAGVLLLARKSDWLLTRRQIILTLLALVALGSGAFLVSLLQRGGGTMDSASEHVMADPRIRNWPAMIDRVVDHPLAGAGYGRQIMRKAYPDLVPKDATSLWHPHNIFLGYGLGMGFPGILAFAALFYCLGRVFWQKLSAGGDREDRLLAICGILLVAGVLARNQFNDFFVRDMALLFWSLAGLFLGYVARRQAARPHPVALNT